MTNSKKQGFSIEKPGLSKQTMTIELKTKFIGEKPGFSKTMTIEFEKPGFRSKNQLNLKNL